MSHYRCLFAVVAVLSAVFYSGCGKGSVDAYDQDRATQPASTTDILAVFDRTIPESHAEAYEELYEDINAITEAAEVVFIGRVVGYKERLYVVPPSADMLAVAEPDWEIVDVYEGIVLEADEVLLGEMPEAGSRITLGVRALQETLDGTSRSRNVNREIALFHDGIKSMGSDDAPRYLVYAGPSGSGGRAHELGLYWIRTRAGVVRVDEDGSLGRGKGMPFVTVWDVNEEGEYEWLLPYVLQDARDAAEETRRGNEYDQAYYSDGTQLTTDPDSLTILDPTIIDLNLHGDGYPHCGITALTEIADVVFVGRIVGYRERLYAVPDGRTGSLEIPARRSVFEGIVLQADSVLLGEMPESGSRITIVEWTLEEGKNELYKQTRLVKRFFPGILAMSTGDGPLYLVYATSSREGTPGADLNLYWQLATSVVQDDGSIDLAERVSFLGTSACASSQHGEQEWAERDYTLQDARDAAAFVKGLGGRRNPTAEWRDGDS